jgi:hypothetical protein
MRRSDMRKILAVMALAILTATLTAQEKVDTAKDGKFNAKFPGNPAKFTKTAGGLTLTAVRSVDEKNRGEYVVFYSDIAPEVLKASQPTQVLEAAENSLKDDFKAKITKSTASTVGTKKYPAREIEAEKVDITGEWKIRGKIVLVGNRLYQVYARGTEDFRMSKDADAFLASFEIVE